MPLEALAKELGVASKPALAPSTDELGAPVEEKAPEADSGIQAAEEMLAAMRSGDAEDLLMAFKSLMRAGNVNNTEEE